MSKKTRKVRLMTAVLAALMLISTLLTVTLSANGTTYYGQSPSISDVTGSINLGTENLFDKSVMFKLPDAVKETDDISLIVQMKSETLLDAYDKSGSKLSFPEFSLTDEANAIRDSIEAEAASIRNDLTGINYELGVSYNVVLSGFEIIIKAGDFANVCKAISDRADVIVGEVYNPAESKPVENSVNVYGTGIFDSSDFGYDGTGTVVAVLDTGVDYYHSAFQDKYYNVDTSKLGLTFDDVAKVLKDNNMSAEARVPGLTAEDVYVSNKIPFGFDYADNDSDVFPLLSNHGTHVAGVIAGNRLEHIESEDYSGEFVGVAPGAQVVAMKIFSDVESSARSSWILAALEDCVLLDVDVINMSIGTACGFSRESDKNREKEIYDGIRARGISLVVAASNSFNSAYSSDKNGNLPLTSNPDSSTVGSPSTYKGALCVASIEGAKTPYLTYNGNIMYFTESNDRFSEQKHFVDELLEAEEKRVGQKVDSLNIEYVVVAGAGRTEADYYGIDVKGKIALIKRGYNTFEEKAALAEKMGAAGVIIYNNVSGDIRMNVGEVKIPVCSISQDNGEIMAAAGSGTITISRSQTSGPFISDFSSWGPTPDLQIKPEITAHGGSILSSVPGESYDRISGTSMATPNISGVTALLRQFIVDNQKYDYIDDNDSVEIAAMVNRLMMSTADITFNKNGLPYSVRKQGAGLANLTDSAATNAYIATYNKDGSVMDKSKIELGDDPDKTGVYILNFDIVNIGSASMTYNLGAWVLTEGVSDTKTAQGDTTVTEEAYELSGAIVEIVSINGGTASDKTITVDGKKTASVSVKITLTEENKKYLNKSFKNGMYVEGYITLNNADDKQDLNVPYLAFYGDWTQAPLFDLDFYETNADELDDSIDPLDKTLPDAYATRPIGGSTGDYVSYLGSYYFEQNPQNKIIAADRKYISLSNQSANNEINSLRFIWAGMLRNAKKVEIVITEDSTGEVVFKTTDEDIRKSYGDGGPIRPANIDVEFSAIDMNLKNNTKYTVTMKGYLDYDDGGIYNNLNNEFSFPIVTDFSAPVLTGCEFYTEFDRSTKTNRLYARLAIYDNHYAMGMQTGYVGTSTDSATGQQSPMFYSFEKYATPIYSEFNSTTYVEYELTDYIDEIMSGAYTKNTFTVAAYDYAMNSATYEIALPDDFKAFGFANEDGSIGKEIHVTLSPNEVYSLSPVVYPATEWGELINYNITGNVAADKKGVAINLVENKIVAVKSGGATVVAKTPDGQTATVKITVLSEGDPGYKEYSKPVVDRFILTGYYTNRAFYMLDNTMRDIGSEGTENKFSNHNYYGLSMYPSESVTLRYELVSYFPESTTISFSSGNEEIAKVDQYGRITAVSEGSVSITANIVMDGKNTLYSATVNINVKEPFITSGPSLSNYFGAGDSSNHVTFPSTLAITEIGQFAFSNYDYVDKDPSEIIPGEAPETMKAWFKGDSVIRSVTIPEGVTRIGAYAFAGISTLEEITLPKSLETIDYGAFYGCVNLKKVNGIENVKFINQSAFQGCIISGNVNLKSAVAIGDYAFAEVPYYDINGNLLYARNQFSTLTLSEDCKSVGAFAFSDNQHLTTLNIESDFLKLGQYAFEGCTKLKAVDINAAVIPTGTFSECKSLKSVNIGKDVAIISEYAFRNTAVDKFTVDENNATYLVCEDGKYLTNKNGDVLLLVAPTVTFFNYNNANITSIGHGAFSSNSVIMSVKLPSVTSLGDFAFSECSKLNIIELGRLEKIGSYAFEKTGLTSFEVTEGMEIGSNAFTGSKIRYVKVCDGATVSDGAFANCISLTTIEIGNNVTIGRNAFRNDQYHAEVSIVTRPVYDAATGGHINKDFDIYTVTLDGTITSLTIGNNVKIGDSAFFGASKLQKVTIGDGAIIGSRAFYNCESLTDIDLSKVISIGDEAFSGDIHYVYADENYISVDINEKNEVTYCYYAPALVSVDLSSLERLGMNAFSNCKSLEKVTLGEKLEVVPYGAFQYCDKLSEINLNKVKVIGDYAFSECAIISADLSKAETIGIYAFCYNAEMTEVKFRQSNVMIEEGAFSYCENLTRIYGEENAYRIGDYAFACTNITEVDLGNTRYLGRQAFYKEEPTEFKVALGKYINNMGDNPFVNCIIAPFSTTVTETFLNNEITTVVYTFDLNRYIKIIDGSIYRIVPNGLELISWMGDNMATVADGTVRISDMAFAGLPVEQVVLPSTLKAIGHKAFFDCDNLMFVTFTSYYAPILEEEYDNAYYESMEHIPAIGDYDFTDNYKNPITQTGKGIIPFFMWNVTSLPGNFFYGANFVDYVGEVDRKITMICPTNGKNYDTFIMDQYFSLTVSGAAAPDEITLAAIEAIKKLPTNVKEINRSHKAMVEAARAAYNKVLSDEQRALIPQDVLVILTNAERRIADLEFETDEEGGNDIIVDNNNTFDPNVIVNIVIGVIFILVVIAFIVVIFVFIRILKINPDILKIKEKEPEKLDEEAEKLRKEEIARYVAAARPTPAPNTPKKPIHKAINIDKLIEKHRTQGKKISLPVLIACIAAAALIIFGIIWVIAGGNDSYLSQFEESGYTLNVTFDTNGGNFKGSDSTIIDLYNPANVKDGKLQILAPDDSRRDSANAFTVTKDGYFLAGWYTNRTLIDPDNPDTGYTYSGRWDFENSRLEVDPKKDYSADEAALTLYAAWVPYFDFEVYAADANGDMICVGKTSAINLTIPQWKDGDITLAMDNFPVRKGYTLVDVYYDAEMTDKAIDHATENGKKMTITGVWHEETATPESRTIKLYTTWQEGERYKIYSASDLQKNASSDGYYELYADLDFTDVDWPGVFTDSKFSGKIIGNGHTISNVAFESNQKNRVNNGLFSTLEANASIENVKFTNITHTINTSSVAPGASFGLLAGNVESGAKLSNVNISGKILIADSCETLIGDTSYTIGLVAGSGSIDGITAEITAEKANPENTVFDVVVENGTVTIVNKQTDTQ